MASIFFYLALIATVHYLYEFLYAPSIRCIIRYKLFEIRDELRLAQINKEISAQHFNILDESINASLNYMSQINHLKIYSGYRKFKQNPELEKLSRQRLSKLESGNDVVKSIQKKHLNQFLKIFLVNTAMPLIYLLPLIIVLTVFLCVLYLFVMLFDKIKTKKPGIKTLLKSILYAPHSSNEEVYGKGLILVHA